MRAKCLSPLQICSFGLLISSLASIQVVSAQTSDADTISALQQQISALTARLDELETRTSVRTQAYATPSVSPAPAASASWTDRIKLKGDFRYRHESFDVDDRADRHRHRIRARTELKAQVSDTINVGLGLASGGNGPISTNQTIGDGASTKPINLDLAYVNWASSIEGLSVTAGKFKNPLYRAGGNGLIWDGDLRPEGVGVTYENGGLFANALLFSVDESSSGEDAILLGGQFGINTAIDDGKLTTGIGYYTVTDAQDRTPFFNGAGMGNRVNPDGSYVSDFDLVEGFAQYSFAAGDSQVTVFADYVQNLEASDFDTGYALGLKVKQPKWNLGWTYQSLEADAVLGTFTDSDFIGGGTDGEGHILLAGYKLSKNVGLRGTLFLNDRNIDFGTEEDFKRLMLDISFKY